MFPSDVRRTGRSLFGFFEAINQSLITLITLIQHLGSAHTQSLSVSTP